LTVVDPAVAVPDDGEVAVVVDGEVVGAPQTAPDGHTSGHVGRARVGEHEIVSAARLSR